MVNGCLGGRPQPYQAYTNRQHMEESSYTTNFHQRSTRRRRRLTRRSLFKSLKKYWLHPGEDLEDSRRLDNTESILKHYYQQTFKNKFRLLPTLLVTTRAAGNVHLAEPTRTSIITFIKFDLALHSRHRLPLRQSPMGRRRQGSSSVDSRVYDAPRGYFALFHLDWVLSLYIALHRRPFRYPQVSIFGPPWIALDSVSTWPFLRHALDLRPGFGYGLGFWVDWVEEDDYLQRIG